jgi:hypothetical protein
MQRQSELLSFTERDKAVLRRLALEVAELAARPVEQEKRDVWYRHNRLEPTRPVIFCDPENGWHEILPQGILTCEDTLARQWEWRLRREIFWGREMRDDRVIEPCFDVPYVYTESDWGMHETRMGGTHGGSYTWDAPLKDYADLDKLRFPQITVHWGETKRQFELACDTFGDILRTRLKTAWYWTLGLTWTAVNLRGLERLMLDMVDQPDNLHRFMAFLRDGTMARLDYLEQSNLLSLNSDGTYVGSGGFGWTTELPAPDFSGRVRCCDRWGFAESQETVGVSPHMFAEFVLPYQIPLLERFGLNCYGCCEPLDKRWRYVQTVPRLRRVSVSPWSDVRVMAENLQDRYVFSWKPNPSYVAMPAFDEEAIRALVRDTLQATRGCRVEMILKDCHTIANDPRRPVRWVEIAREEAEQ